MTDLNALAAAADGFATILEIAAGHRQKAENQGFSPTAAEHMAVHLHNQLITKALTKTTP